MKYLIIILMLACSTSFAMTTEEMLAKAPTLIIAIDNSSSTPAADQAIVEKAWPIIERKIRAMPIASNITVFTVGDASQPFTSQSLRIQKKTTETGGDIDVVVNELKNIVLGFPSLLKNGTIAAQGRTELIGGLADASRLLNEQADSGNAIIMISDLIENSPYASCGGQKCKLPSPSFSLKGTEITVLGAGNGLPSNLSEALIAEWNGFFQQAGAKNTDIKRVY